MISTNSYRCQKSHEEPDMSDEEREIWRADDHWAQDDSRPQRHGWAPGGYAVKCSTCGKRFSGDKWARTCAPCAYAEPDVKPKPPAIAAFGVEELRAEVERLRATIKAMSQFMPPSGDDRVNDVLQDMIAALKVNPEPREVSLYATSKDGE